MRALRGLRRRRGAPPAPCRRGDRSGGRPSPLPAGRRAASRCGRGAALAPLDLPARERPPPPLRGERRARAGALRPLRRERARARAPCEFVAPCVRRRREREAARRPSRSSSLRILKEYAIPRAPLRWSPLLAPRASRSTAAAPIAFAAAALAVLSLATL